MSKNKHNGKISFWKFMFSLMIVALHLGVSHTNYKYHFEAGSIAVDFFFIVSGYLFCKKVLNLKLNSKEELGKKTFNFFIKKVVKFLPYIIFLWIISIPFSIFVNKLTFLDFTRAFFNLLYIPIYNNSIYNIYGITWYISAMIITETVLFPLLIKFKENFVYIMSPIIVFFLGNYIFIKYGNVAVPWDLGVFCYKGILRAFFDINLGMLLYMISMKINKIKLTDFSRFSLTIIEIVGYISIFSLANKINAHMKYDYLMIIILAVCILISFSKKAYLNDFCNNKFFYYLEKLSLLIYLNQWFIIELVEFIIKKFSFNISYYYELLVIIIMLIILGIIEFKILKFIKSKWKDIKAIFIENN